MDRGQITLHNETVASFPRHLVSQGLPLPPGWAKSLDEVSIRDEAGAEIPSAGRVLQTRPDGSIEWALIDYILDFDSEQTHKVYLAKNPNTHPQVEHAVTIEETDGQIHLHNGLTHLVLNRQGSLIDTLSMHARVIVSPEDRVDLETVDMNGKVYRASVADEFDVTIEDANDLRATVLVQGKHAARDGSTFLDFALRFTMSAGRAEIKVMHTFFVREPSEGMTEVKSIRFVMPTQMSPTAEKMIHQAHHGREWWPRYVDISENVEMVSSSVSDLNTYAANYKPHAMGTLFLRNVASLNEKASDYPFYISPAGGTAFRADHMVGGVRQAYPYLGWRDNDFTLVFGMRYWKQLHPKSVSIDENLLTVSIWPDWATPMKVVQGVSKSHTFWLQGVNQALSAEEAEQVSLQWEIQGYDPVGVSIDPDWPRFCEVLDLHHFVSRDAEARPKLEEMLQKVVPGEPDRFTYPRHQPNGMFNFGDAGGPSFTNNEDDVRCFVPLLEYLRSGSPYCLDFAQETVQHYMEVDHVEWSSVLRGHGGLIPHTNDHFFGEVYPSHQWSEGVLAWYYLTGDERAKQVVIKVGDNHIFWVENLLPQVVCDGREAGVPLVNLAMSYRVTGDQKYIDAGVKIIDNFQRKWFEKFGQLKYPYPQGAMLKWTKDYGNWSTYYGMYRLWEVTQSESIKDLLVKLLQERCVPERFSVDDSRGMDFFAVWAYIQLTGDDAIVDRLPDAINNMLAKGGHPMRRLHFLGLLEKRGDERLV